jgi:hypothetical protein
MIERESHDEIYSSVKFDLNKLNRRQLDALMKPPDRRTNKESRLVETLENAAAAKGQRAANKSTSVDAVVRSGHRISHSKPLQPRSYSGRPKKM